MTAMPFLKAKLCAKRELTLHFITGFIDRKSIYFLEYEHAQLQRDPHAQKKNIVITQQFFVNIMHFCVFRQLLDGFNHHAEVLIQKKMY